MPLAVRLFYVNQYYDMARQAYKKQYNEYNRKLAQLQQQPKFKKRNGQKIDYTLVNQIEHNNQDRKQAAFFIEYQE